MTVVSKLTFYPIKACRGFDADSTFIQRMGLEHDRRMMLVTPQGGFLTQRDHPRLALVNPQLAGERLTLSAPGMPALSLSIHVSGSTCAVDIWRSRNVPAIDQGEAAAEWFSTWLEAQVRLVHIAPGFQRVINEKYALRADDHTGFADGYPILLTSEESLAELNGRLESPVPMDRFRPNLVVRGSAPFAEDNWSQLRIGDIELAIVKPCARCVVTTFDKETLERSKEPLKTLNTFRKQAGGAMFGYNVIPLNEGRLEVGMNVEILS